MFENAIAGRERSAKPAASLTVSLVVHGGVIALALIGGSYHSQAEEPTPEISVAFRAPPPPPPPPPPARAKKTPQPKTKILPKQMVQPKELPPEQPPPPPEEPEAPPESADEGEEGGVEGGVAGGVAGGVLGPATPVPEPEKPKGPVEFDDKMTRPAKLSGPDPEYTDQAIEREIQGTVVIKCVVTVEGIVKNCRVVQSLPFMDKAVIDALVKRRYSPALFQGKPIDVDYTFTIRLKLPE